MELLDKVLVLARKLPEHVYFSMDTPGVLQMQCYNQKSVKEVMKALDAGIWRKQYSKGCKWWDYYGEKDGITLVIIACKEAPPTCKAIKVKKIVKKQVPTAFEEVEEEVEVLEWDCGQDG